MAFFQPDRYFSRVSAISAPFDIVNKGFEYVLMDVDNTLLTRDEHIVPADVQKWLGQLRESGVQVCLLSNNFHEGVNHLADKLGLPIVAKAVKPLPHGYLMAMKKLGGNRRNTLMIGDQLITDVLGAHFLGMTAYMVCPLVEADLKHTLLLRNVEALFMAGRVPEDVAAPVGAPASVAEDALGALCDSSEQ